MIEVNYISQQNYNCIQYFNSTFKKKLNKAGTNIADIPYT